MRSVKPRLLQHKQRWHHSSMARHTRTITLLLFNSIQLILCLIEASTHTTRMSLHLPSLFKRPNLLNQMTWLLVKFADFQYKHLFAAAMLSRADTALASRLKHGAPFSLWMYSILLRPGASSGLMCCPGQLWISRYKYISQSFLSQILKSLITLLTTIRLPIVLN